MKPLHFIIIGSGWRSLFFTRIAKAYPRMFVLDALLCRTEEKADNLKTKLEIHTTISEEECMSYNPDFVVVAVDKDSLFSITKRWALKGYPVLCETPAATNLKDLQEIWQLHKKLGLKIQIAEQYFLYPSYAAGLEVVKKGYLGDPNMMTLSAVHDYHAASLIRRFLNVGFENMKVYGKRYPFSIVETDSRDGLIRDGRMSTQDRVRITFEFENRKTAFYDFTGVQYHSRIRSRHLNVQGERGELDDCLVRFVDADYQSHECRMEAVCYEGSQAVREIVMGQEVLYQNPFAQAGEVNGMPQDETAIGTMMLGMRRYIEEGIEVYPLAEGLQDAYVRVLMEEALNRDGRVVTSVTQEWS